MTQCGYLFNSLDCPTKMGHSGGNKWKTTHKKLFLMFSKTASEIQINWFNEWQQSKNFGFYLNIIGLSSFDPFTYNCLSHFWSQPASSLASQRLLVWSEKNLLLVWVALVLTAACHNHWCQWMTKSTADSLSHMYCFLMLLLLRMVTWTLKFC